MREYDDDNNIQHYAPVLRRIIILVAVITAVPVMLWTITAFMHTYIAQPTIPSPQTLAPAPAAAPPASPGGGAGPRAAGEPGCGHRQSSRTVSTRAVSQRRQYRRAEWPSRCPCPDTV